MRMLTAGVVVVVFAFASALTLDASAQGPPKTTYLVFKDGFIVKGTIKDVQLAADAGRGGCPLTLRGHRGVQRGEAVVDARRGDGPQQLSGRRVEDVEGGPAGGGNPCAAD